MYISNTPLNSQSNSSLFSNSLIFSIGLYFNAEGNNFFGERFDIIIINIMIVIIIENSGGLRPTHKIMYLSVDAFIS